MAFVPVFQIQQGWVDDNGVDAHVRLWVETSRGNALVVERLLKAPAPPTPITKAQVFSQCRAIANALEAAEATQAAKPAPVVFSDPTIYDATQAGGVAASPANIAPLTGAPPLSGATA